MDQPLSPPGNPFESQPFLIIAGAAKSGTTALFEALSTHPQICPAVEKEIGFFADSATTQGLSYSHLPDIRFEDGVQAYAEFFPDPGSRTCLEATGLYMASPGAPARIRRTLPRARVMFILRNPLERFVSLFGFQKQLGWIPAGLPLEGFFDGCAASSRFDRFGLNPLKISLDFVSSIERFYEVFPENSILVQGFADLHAAPVGVLEAVARFADLDPDIFPRRNILAANPTQAIRLPTVHKLYTRATQAAFRQRFRFPRTVRALRGIHLKTTKRWYFGVNGRPPAPSAIPERVRLRFQEALPEQERRLEALIGRKGCLRPIRTELPLEARTTR